MPASPAPREVGPEGGSEGAPSQIAPYVHVPFVHVNVASSDHVPALAPSTL